MLADPTRAELPNRILRGVGWKFASQMSTQVTKTIVVVVLARLLGPNDFGVAGMVIVLSAFVVSYADFGLGFALVQRPSITELDRSSVFWASLAIGGVITGLCVVAAPLVADFYHRAEVAPLFAVLSLSFVVTSLGSTQRSLLARSMNFRSLELRTIAGVVSGAVVGVVLAVLGYGPWALVGQQLGSVVVSTAMLWIMTDWRPRWMFSWKSVRELGAFGGRYLGGTTFLILNQNVDNLLVGRYLGAAALGVYSLAYSVILVPLSRIVWPIQQVLAPAFSRVQDDKHALGLGWIRSTRLLAIVCVPMMVTISLLAHDLIVVGFGDRWSPAIPVVQILALVCAIQCLRGLHDIIIQALGRMKVYLRLSALSFALNLIAFIVGLLWGIVGVAAAFGISTAIYAIVSTIIVAHMLELPLRRFLGSLIGVVQAGTALVLVELGARSILTESHLGPLVRLVVVSVAGVAIFLPILLWRMHEARSDLSGVLQHLRRRAPIPAPAPPTPQVASSAP